MIIEGKLLGNRYEIIEKIGNGGMATVYKATDKVLKRYVAVKILRDEFTTDDEFIKRFEVEAQSAARLSHSNIVSIYDVGVDENLYYIVMELIQGKTLKEIIIEERQPLPWKWSVNVAIQVASALEMAHRNNIVHRDIKPHNIIITEDGVAKVTDFGIAKAVSNSTITAFGTTIGSVHYFSPEHARGGYTDAKSDLYSLGVVMYEMVTGKVPFDADTPVSVALKHMQEEPIEPIELNPNLPTSLNKIIMKALQKDTTLRYQSATEMIQDLKKALKNPNGDFVEELEYDATAKTQKIDMNMYNSENGEDKEKKKKKEGKLRKFVKKHKAISIFIMVVLLFSLSLGGTIFALNITNPPEVEMPKVVGLTKEEAKKAIEAVGLVYKEEKEEYSKDVKEGEIISQNPTYMEKYNSVKKGSTVSVVVSKGLEKTIVPKVVGKEQQEAIAALEAAKLKAEVVEETSQKVEKGYVISQEVEADAEAFADDIIKIHVSIGTGIKQVKMTSVVGKQEATAKQEIESLGLVAKIEYTENQNKENGIVLQQSVNSGETINEGTSITLTVNKIAETKTATVSIDVKSITGGYLKEDAESNDALVKTVTIELTYGDRVETRTNVDKNQTQYKIPISGKDNSTQNVKIVVKESNQAIYQSSQDIRFGTQDTITFKQT